MITIFYSPYMHKHISLFNIVFGFLVLLMEPIQGVLVYGPSPYFFTEYCGYNSFISGTTTTICPFTYPQNDIRRMTIALAQVSKPSGYHIVFSTSFSLSINYPHTSMTLVVSVGGLTSTLRLGFFVLIIKTQPTAVYIDFINFGVDAGSALNNDQPTIRSTSQLNNINIDSFMTYTDINDLKFIPFTTQLIFYTDSSVYEDPRFEYSMMFQYTVTVYTSNSIQHTLTIQPYTTMYRFNGFALLINYKLFLADQQAYVANPSLTPNDYVLMQFITRDPSAGEKIDFQASFPYFGTSFDHKCILGIQKMKFTKLTQFQFTMVNNTYDSFTSYSQLIKTPSRIPQSLNNFFCHGYSIQCSDSTPNFDSIDGKCYTNTTCPLSLPNAMPVPYRCPWCEQFMCQVCNATNRKQCITCQPGTNSFLNTTTNLCQCNPGKLPVYLDLFPYIYSGGATHSLLKCTGNCTQAMEGCVDNKCTNESYCQQCLTGYLLIPLGSNQYCSACINFISQCLSCSDTYFCDVCAEGYYIKDVMSSPTLPTDPAVLIGRKCEACYTNCKDCTNNTQCNQCYPGYSLQSNACKCDPVSAQLKYCQSCTVNTTCYTCYAGYFLSPTTSLCQICLMNSIGCSTCLNQNTCTTCIAGYGLITIGPNTTCDVCFLNINYCDQCNDVNTCLHCMPPFGLDNPTLCTYCESLKFPGCIQCLDAASPCTKCNSTSFLINGSCFFCLIQHPNCVTCQTNPTYQVLDCIQCQAGYYIHFNPITHTQQCLLCIDAIHKCGQCVNQTFCTKCIYPNQLSPDNFCSYCNANFANYSGLCFDEAGCMDVYEPTPGNQTCLACRDYLHYYYQPQYKACECQLGYVETIDIVAKRKCVPICGDGILIPQDQQCDDQNDINHDGCDTNCTTEKNFKCSQTSPSKCVLYQNFTTFEYIYVQRVLGQNKGILHFTIQPSQISLSIIDWSKIISFNFSSTSVYPPNIGYNYVSERGELLVTVPYNEDLQTLNIQYSVYFDPTIIASSPITFISTEKLIGINAPLIIEDSFLLSTCNILSIVSLVLSILALIQFYIGSFMNKMIGLQTLQIIQLTFFIRIVVSNKNTSIMNCLNSFVYCSTGYSNPQVIFEKVGIKKSQQILHEFLQIGIQKYFLMNVNFWLILLGVALAVYFLLILRKQVQKHNFLSGKEPQLRQKFIKIHRSTQWMYSHFIFPQVMMLSMIAHFSVVLTLELNENIGPFEISKVYMESISFQMLLQFVTCCLFTFQLFRSLNFILTKQSVQQLSLIQKLQHDQQSIDKANYHPLYVFAYLSFYLIQMLAISIGVEIESFHFALQTVILMNAIYLGVISCWKPYFTIVNFHNKILRFNHCVAIICLIVYQIVHRTQRLSSMLYIVLVSIMLASIFLLITCGFYRVLKQHQYRKKLAYAANNKFTKNTDLFATDEKSKILTKQQRKQALLQNNPYSFKNQFQQLKQVYNHSKGFKQQRRLTQQDERQIVLKIREQFKEKNNFYQDLISDNYHHYNEPLQGGLINTPILVKQVEKLSNYDSKVSHISRQQTKQQPNEKDQTLQRKGKSNQKRAVNAKSRSVAQKETLQRIKGRLKAEWRYIQQL